MVQAVPEVKPRSLEQSTKVLLRSASLAGMVFRVKLLQPRSVPENHIANARSPTRIADILVGLGRFAILRSKMLQKSALPAAPCARC